VKSGSGNADPVTLGRKNATMLSVNASRTPFAVPFSSNASPACVGAMSWKLPGTVTVAHADGTDVSRSAAGPAGAEGIWLIASDRVSGC
jgi:hypothetical protein